MMLKKPTHRPVRNNPDGAQEALDNAVDNLNDAIDTADSREDWASIKDAAEAGVQAAQVMQDQDTADAMDEVAKTASQELNEQKWGIVDKDTGQFIEDQGTPMTFEF